MSQKKNENYIMGKDKANANKKKAGLANLIPDKVTLRKGEKEPKQPET